jgi:hypothetical protein
MFRCLSVALLTLLQPDPLVCKCQNGGLCLEDDGSLRQCACPDNFVGQFCDIRRDGTGLTRGASSPAAVVVPVILIIAVIVCAMALYVYYQRKRKE